MSFFQGIGDWSQFIIRLIAAVGGFVVGYLVSGPAWRVVWRVAFRQPVKPGQLPWLKVCTGLVIGTLLYTLVHLGAGGWGWGGGGGSGTGSGVGDGKGSGKSGGDGDSTTKKGGPASTKNPGREIVVVELLGGTRYLGDGKYYLLDRKEPAVTIETVRDAFKKQPEKIELHVHYSPQSVGQRHEAARRLRDLAGELRIPHVETIEDEK